MKIHNKKVICFLFFIFLFFVPNYGFADLVHFEGFEDNNSYDTYGTNHSSFWSLFTGSTAVVTHEPHSGNFSFRGSITDIGYVDEITGKAGAVNPHCNIGIGDVPYGATSNFDIESSHDEELYVEWFHKWDVDEIPDLQNDTHKIVRLYTNQRYPSDSIIITMTYRYELFLWVSADNHAGAPWQYGPLRHRTGYFMGTFPQFNDGEYHKFAIYIKYGTGSTEDSTLKIWIDDVPIVDEEDSVWLIYQTGDKVENFVLPDNTSSAASTDVQTLGWQVDDIAIYDSMPAPPNNDRNFYADQTATGDNSGTSPENAFTNMSAINSHAFSDGDHLYFRTDQRWNVRANNQVLTVDWNGLSDSDRSHISCYYMNGNTPVHGTDPGFTLSGHAMPIFDGGSTTTDRGFPNDSYRGLVHISYRDFIDVSYLDLRNSGGNGVYLVNADNCSVRHCRVDFVYASGIMFNNSANGLAEYNEALRIGTQTEYFGITTWGFGIGGVNPRSTGTVLRHNKVYDCWSECLGNYRGADDGLIEYNDTYNCQKVHIYVSEAERNIVRYNKVYGTTNTNFHRNRTGYAGQGIYTSHENRSNEQTLDNEIYGNVIAYVQDGIRLGANIGGRNTTGLVNTRVFNNTIIDCLIGVRIYGDDITNTEFSNNIIWNPSGGATVLIDQQQGNDLTGLTFRNNLWIKSGGRGPEESGARHSSDPGYPNYNGLNSGMEKMTGWQSLTAGNVSISDFALTAGSNAIDAGMVLAAPYNDIFHSSSDYSTIPFNVQLRRQGDSPEIGAVIYGDAPPPPPPALILSGAAPSVQQACGSDPQSVNMSVSSNRNAQCRYSNDPSDMTYADMPNQFVTGEGTMSHGAVVSQACGGSTSFNVICNDGSVDSNMVSILVDVEDYQPPPPEDLLLSGPSPTARQNCTEDPQPVEISVVSNRNAMCRHSSNTNHFTYNDMTNQFATGENTTTHRTNVFQECGGSTRYYVICNDGSVDSDRVSINVRVAPESPPPPPPHQDRVCHDNSQTVTLFMSSDENATCQNGPNSMHPSSPRARDVNVNVNDIIGDCIDSGECYIMICNNGQSVPGGRMRIRRK